MKHFRKCTFIGLLVLLMVSCGSKSSAKKTEDTTTDTMAISDSLKWADRMAMSIIKRREKLWMLDDKTKPHWNYKIGLVALSLQKLSQANGNKTYANYVKTYTEDLVDSTGTILGYNKEKYNIDMVNSGKVLFNAYVANNDPKYKIALDTLRSQLVSHPRTKSGGFWHKKIYPNQMWLDGLYMGAPFYARYNSAFENGDKLDDVVHQFSLIFEKTLDSKTGMLLHAWDESKKMDWADNVTGKAPNFWSRSMGWYVMALVDALDYFPENHPKRKELISLLEKVSTALVAFQDPTGIWYQVPNMGGKEGNYLEASGTCMFAYAFAKGVNKGYLPEKFRVSALKAFNGVVKELIKVDADGEVHLTNICKSAGLGGNPYRDGSFEYYISEPIITNNSHGLGPFILAATVLNK